MSRLKIRKWKNFTLGSALMLGTSLGGTAYLMENFNPEKISDRTVRLESFYPEKISDSIIAVVGKTDIPIQQFYDSLEEKDGQWYARLDGKTYNLHELTDYRTKSDVFHNSQHKNKTTTIIDTVRVERDQSSRRVIYAPYATADTLDKIPNLGTYNKGKIHICHFVSNDPELQKYYDLFNNEYNRTWRHEYQHFLNARAGIDKSGQSYETKFAEMCFNEISANIAQLLEQRRQYFEHGRNSKYITNQFKFYRDYLNGMENADPEKINPAEAKFIAEGTFDMWIKRKLPLYYERNFKRTKNCLAGASYAGCIDHPQQHRQLMYKMFKIDGIDFSQYLNGKEDELLQKLPQNYKDEIVALMREKKQNMTYLDKVGLKTNNDSARKYNYFKGLKLKNRWNRLTGRTAER